MTSEAQTQEIKPDVLQRLEEVPVTNDVLAYTLACMLALAPRTSASVVAAVERQVRATYGGDEVFIAKDLAGQRRQRNEQIKRDYLSGERMALLERRYKLSERRLFQIIKSD